MRAEDKIESDAGQKALSALREMAGEDESPMERHCLRVYLIVERMAQKKGHSLDRDALMVASLLHDCGLYEEASDGGVYVTEGAEYSDRLLEPFDWSPERVRLAHDMIERHHRLTAQWKRGAEVELVRQADLVEVTSGLVSHGLDRRWLRELDRDVSRDGLYTGIAKLVGGVVRHRPATLPGVFTAGSDDD